MENNTTTETVRSIPTYFLDDLRSQVAKVNARAAKHGLDGEIVTRLGEKNGQCRIVALNGPLNELICKFVGS